MTQQLTLREARRRRKSLVTQEQLAKRTGLDQTYISLIECGRRRPSDDVRKRLAKALGIAPSRLRFADPEPNGKVPPSRDKEGQPGHTNSLERASA
jgi:transcriptional regulator with XRE-family HTH domain